MKRWLPAALALPLAALAAPPPATDFKGHVLGAPVDVEQLKEAWHPLRCFENFERITTCDGYTSIADAEASVRAVIRADGTLGKITLLLKASEFPAVRTALRSKFGTPTKVERSTVRNTAGAPFPDEVHTWVRADGVVMAAWRAGAVDTASVLFVSKAQMAQDVAEEHQRRKKQRTDL